MTKLRVFVALIALLLLGVSFAASVPASYIASLLTNGNVAVVEGSELVAGRAVWAFKSDKYSLISWRWCPSDGLFSFCISLSGSHGFATGVVTAGSGGWRVSRFSFSGLPISALGLQQTFIQGHINGEIDNFTLHQQGECLSADLHETNGVLELSKLSVWHHALTDHQLHINNNSIVLKGRQAQGDFTIDSHGNLKGKLQASPPQQIQSSLNINIKNADNKFTMDVNLPVFCKNSGR